MAVLPDVVKRLADDIQWTTDLGNAFLAQQSDVMDAVQRMRKKAQGTGALEIERAAEGGNQGRRDQDGDRHRTGQSAGRLRALVQPDGRLRSADLSVSADLLPAVPAARWSRWHDLVRRRHADGRGVGGGGWGWGCGWGGNDIDINVNNNFNRNNNINNANINVNRAATPATVVAQLEPPGRRAVREPGHRGSVRRHGARRLAVVPAVRRAARSSARGAGGRRRSSAPAGPPSSSVSGANRLGHAAAATGSADREVPTSSSPLVDHGAAVAHSAAVPAAPAAPRVEQQPRRRAAWAALAAAAAGDRS